jgi:hypothetical protein
VETGRDTVKSIRQISVEAIKDFGGIGVLKQKLNMLYLYKCGWNKHAHR